MFPLHELNPVHCFKEKPGQETFTESDINCIKKGLSNIAGLNQTVWEMVDATCAKISVKNLPEDHPEEIICYVRKLIIGNSTPQKTTFSFSFTRHRYADWFEHR